MGRIRSIKPAFFLHEELFDLEKESGLPVRVAFAGLWCQCDREGRFRWRPRQLKATVLPYDDLDFERVLDALATRNFIVKYQIDAETYGYIPTWLKHQIINHREAKSQIPEPLGETPAYLGVPSHFPGGNMEGNMEYGNPLSPPSEGGQSALADFDEIFAEFWQVYPAREGKKVGESATRSLFAKLSPADRTLALIAVRNYADYCKKTKQKPCNPKRFLVNGRGNGKDTPWREWLEPAVQQQSKLDAIIEKNTRKEG